MTLAYRDDGARWKAVQQRERAADGSFVYAVRTTKIYCRPVCTARLARRDNVEFFDQPREAESAGYRPCKRCKPEGGMMPEAAATTRIRALIQQEMQQRNSSDGVRGGDVGDIAKTTSRLARKAQVSKWHFHRTFKEITGSTPSEYFAQHRPSIVDNTVSTMQQDHATTTTDGSPHINVTPDVPTPAIEDADLFGRFFDWSSLCDDLSIELALQQDDLFFPGVILDNFVQKDYSSIAFGTQPNFNPGPFP